MPFCVKLNSRILCYNSRDGHMLLQINNILRLLCGHGLGSGQLTSLQCGHLQDPVLILQWAILKKDHYNYSNTTSYYS
jgi:hypothetical protein